MRSQAAVNEARDLSTVKSSPPPRPREAALKSAAAERYPFLPVRMWTEASRVVALVARHRSQTARAEDQAALPLRLPQADFMFRGGGRARRHGVAGPPEARTRVDD